MVRLSRVCRLCFASAEVHIYTMTSIPKDFAHARRRQESVSQGLFYWQRMRQLENRSAAACTVVGRRVTVARVLVELGGGSVHAPDRQRHLEAFHCRQRL